MREKIQRIRQKDKQEQEAFEKRLQQELEAKKRRVREEQKKEMLKSIMP